MTRYVSASSLIVCHACDLVQRIEPAPPPVRIRCRRCRAELYRTYPHSLDTAISWAICALVLAILANLYPLVALKLNGVTRQTTLAGAALGLYQQGYPTIAVLVAFTTIAVPLAQILVYLWVLVGLKRRRGVGEPLAWFRGLAPLRPWGMVEVFLLGALVALTKLSGMADIVPGIALVCYGLLMLPLAALASATPTEQFWRWVEQSRG